MAEAAFDPVSDLIKMKWDAIETIDGHTGINVTQKKTGKKLWIPSRSPSSKRSTDGSGGVRSWWLVRVRPAPPPSHALRRIAVLVYRHFTHLDAGIFPQI